MLLTAFASSFGFSLSTNIPTSGVTKSGKPPSFVAITGVPQSIASAATNPNGSLLDGTQEHFAILYISFNLDCGWFPKNFTFFNSNLLACSSSSSLSSPSPAIIVIVSLSSYSFIAFNKISTPLNVVSFPTKLTIFVKSLSIPRLDKTSFFIILSFLKICIFLIDFIKLYKFVHT